MVEEEPEVVHEDNEWGISLVEDEGDTADAASSPSEGGMKLAEGVSVTELHKNMK